jgi:hypothetical protein
MVGGSWWGKRFLSFALLASTASACSLALSGPGPFVAGRVPVCDTGKGLVVVDGTLGGLFSLSALALFSNNLEEGAILPGLLAAAFIGAATHGNSNVNACVEAMNDFQLTLEEQQPAPRRLPKKRRPGPRAKATPETPAIAATPTSTPAPPAATPAATPAPSPGAPRPAAPPAPASPWRDFWSEVP